MKNSNIVICSPVRTPISSFGGSLKNIPASKLGSSVVRETLKRSGLPADNIESVVMGQVIQAGTKMNPARQAAIGAGLPVEVPAFTVNRVCGSGAQAIATAALEVAAGCAKAVIAGGMENMDKAPYFLPNGRWGTRMGNAEILDSLLSDGLNDAFSGKHSGWHTEDLVKYYGITREDQDKWAARSQQRFSKAQKAGFFEKEIVSVDISDNHGVMKFERDEANRPDTTFDTLSTLKPAFRKDGTITAGNAPGLNSGASAMIIADRNFAEKNGMIPYARFVGYAVSAVDPGMFGIGPVSAVRMAIERAGWNYSDIERIEINEAFAAITIACLREMRLPEEIVNTDGGAIAHGHAIGATGAVLTTRLIHSMQRDGLKRGIVTLCIGGGQAIALALEVL